MTFFLYCTCFTVTSNNYDTRWQLFTWTSCANVTVTVQLPLSLLWETSEHVSAYNSQKISSYCRKFLGKAMNATEGKQKEYLNEWSACCSLLVLKIGVMTGLFVCNLKPKHPAPSWQSPWSDKSARLAKKCVCRTLCKKTKKLMTRQQRMGEHSRVSSWPDGEALKLVINTYYGRVWTGFIWLRTQRSGEVLWTR